MDTFYSTNLQEETLNYLVDLVRRSGQYHVTPVQDSAGQNMTTCSVTTSSGHNASFQPWSSTAGRNLTYSLSSSSAVRAPPSISGPYYNARPPPPPVHPRGPLHTTPAPRGPLHATATVSDPMHSTPAPHGASFRWPPPPLFDPSHPAPDVRALAPGLNPRVPKLPEFSGEVSGDEYDIWVYEVNCLLRGRHYSDQTIMEAMRRSLKGKARSVLLHLGEFASITDIIRELEGMYGNVGSSEKLLEKFYSASQLKKESVVEYSLRLEQLLRHSSILLDPVTKNEMLRSRLWSGLRNDLLKNVSRYKYETIGDFNELRRELRKIEQDLERGAASASGRLSTESKIEKHVRFECQEKAGEENSETSEEAVSHMTSVESRLLKQMQSMSEQLKGLDRRMSSMEKEMKVLKERDGGKKDNYQFQKKNWGNRDSWNKKDSWNKNKNTNKDTDTNTQKETPKKDLNRSGPPSQGQ